MIAIGTIVSWLSAITAAVKNKLVSLKDFFIVLLVFITIGSAGIAYNFYHWNKELDQKLGTAISNKLYYESQFSVAKDDNRVLKLNIADLSHSNDSLVQHLNETRKSLKIKENALKQALSIQTVIRDTVTITLPDSMKNVVDFTTKLEHNPLTKFTISRRGEEVTCIPEIYDRQDLFIYSSDEYRNKKNFLQRLFTWDWKKDRLTRYAILHSNLAIQVLDTRIVEITK